MKYLSDMHTHSIASGHGTSCTISDMAKKAAQNGLRLLGITDHGPATLAAGTSSYFRSLTFSPKRRFDVDLLYGIELNILDTEGSVDLEEELLSRLDYAIASMHAQNYRPGTCEENTRAFINVMKNPHVKILGHCDNPQYPVDYEALAACAKKEQVLLEINEASLAPYGYRGDTRQNNTEILRWCAKYRTPVLLSSDSHGTEHIGDFTFAADFVHQAMFPEELIYNNQIPKLKVFLADR
ncbi:MAG: phosphatase [Eubacteriales bacterium]|nr:phosphatase [Eubacteriales bacterium]